MGFTISIFILFLYFIVQKAEDDSIHNFVKRRFGSDIADYVIDPVIRGICGGKN